jgi:hypothetical protein
MSAEGDRPDDGTNEQPSGSNRRSDADRRTAPAEERQRRPRRRESITESLSRPAARNQLKYTIGLFAEIGLGFGLTGFLVIELLASGDGFGAQFVAAILTVIILGVTLLTGPVIAAFSGIRIAEGLREEARTVYLTSAVGNFVGYFIMVVITVLLIAATGGGVNPGTVTGGGGGGGSLFDLGDLLVPMIALAIPVALVGAGTAYLHLNVGASR